MIADGRANLRVENILELLRTTTRAVTIVANGRSMLPTIRPGDQVSLRSISESEKIDDNEIVAFVRKRKIICHRVLFTWRCGNHRYIYEKGDNNFLGRFITLRDIIGKVVAVNGNNYLPKAPENLSPLKILIRRCTDGAYRLTKFFQIHKY